MTAVSDQVSDLARQVETLLDSGQGRAAVDLVTRHVIDAADGEADALAVATRHRAAVRHLDQVAPLEGDWPTPTPDHFAGAELAEIPASELTSELLASALEHHGSLIIRGLIPTSTAERLLEDTMQAMDAARRYQAGDDPDSLSPWYVPFNADEQFSFGQLDRKLTYDVGVVLTAESPRTFGHLMEAFAECGLGEVLTGYLGARPMLSAKKSSLRRATPTSPTEWHQDGAFLGESTRTVNCWIALTDCGVDAPSVELFPRPFEQLVPTGDDSAWFHWSVGPDTADALGTDRVIPEFAPGDAMLFNQLTLHRTAVDPAMTKDRYAIESWFFAPSCFPYKQVPILF